jgi:hypothetical protein
MKSCFLTMSQSFTEYCISSSSSTVVFTNPPYQVNLIAFETKLPAILIAVRLDL